MQETPETRLAGTRVEFHGLKRAADLNGTHGVVLRYDASTGRFAVRREVSCADEESAAVKVRAANFRVAPRHEVLSSLQRLVDAAPAGARVTLPVGAVAADAPPGGDDGDEPASSSSSSSSSSGGSGSSSGGSVLILRRAIRLVGLGGRAHGTELRFGVQLSPDLVGEVVELAGLHVVGPVDVSPLRLTRVRLSGVSITAPAGRGAGPALAIDELGAPPPAGDEADRRVLLDGCWVRGGEVGLLLNSAGCTLRDCRVQGAGSYGVRSNALFFIEGCTIGGCGVSGGGGGGIIARQGLTELRAPNGTNENRVQGDHNDRGYSGYRDHAQGCFVGRCVCGVVGRMMAGQMPRAPEVRWGQSGAGKWQHMGVADG